MRVYVEHDVTVNHDTSIVTLKAGQIVEGPLAVYLVESDCDVTIEQDDRPAATPEPTPAPAPDPADPADPSGGEQSHTPGSGEQTGTGDPGGEQASSETVQAAEPSADPGAAE